MRQAAFSNGLVFDRSPSLDDGRVPTEVDIGRRKVAEAFMVATVIVALNESADAGFKITKCTPSALVGQNC